jgi:hypothetical protein
MCLFVIHIRLEMVVELVVLVEVWLVLVDMCRVDMDQIGLCHIGLWVVR